MKGTDTDKNVPRKTPEEIKKSLKRCGKDRNCHKFCSYWDIYDCTGELFKDALAYIEQLQWKKDVAEAHAIAKTFVIDRLKRERDAAVEILRSMRCDTCIYDEHYPIPNVCFDCVEYCNWEWRGVKEEKNNG